MEGRMNTRAVEQRPLAALGRIGVVAGLHVAVIYLVATGLGITPTMIPTKMVGTIIPSEDPQDPVPPPIGPPKPENNLTVHFPEPYAPLPDLTDANASITGQASPDPVPLPPIETAPGPLLTSVRMDARFPLTQPPYPPGAVRAEQEGAVEMEVYVLPNGRVGDARVVKSTGYALLDQAALDEAKRRWRLQPATRDGAPYAQWHRLRVVFELRNR
jgi:protein TonB